MNITILDQSKHTLHKPALILRDLWRDLELTEKYAEWFLRQLTEFAQDVDYVRVQVYLNPTNNLPITDVAVTLETAKHIALMSRTAKGREYRQRLIELEAQMFSCTSQPQFNLPTTYLDALKCLVAETEAHNETKAVMQQATGYLETAVGILKRDAPKVKVHDAIMHSEGALLISDAARVLNVSQTKLFTFLERSRWIFRAGKHKKYKAYAPHIHNGNLVQLVKVAVNHDGDPVVTSQVQITAQGIAVLANLLVG